MTALDPQELAQEPRLRALALMAAKDALYPSVRADWQPSVAELTYGLVDLAEYVVQGNHPGGHEAVTDLLREVLTTAPPTFDPVAPWVVDEDEEGPQ